MIRGLEHVCCEDDRLRKLRLFGLQKAPGRSYRTFQYLRGPTRKIGRDSLSGIVVTE